MAQYPSLGTQINNAVHVPDIIKESLERVKARIIQQMAANNRNASKSAVNSLDISITQTGGTLWGNNYFFAMETGRKGGKIPSDFTTILYDWVIDKGISLQYHHRGSKQTKIRSAVYLIARKIAREGTVLHRSGTRDDIYSSVIDEEFNSLTQKIWAQFASNINYINSQYANI